MRGLMADGLYDFRTSTICSWSGHFFLQTSSRTTRYDDGGPDRGRRCCRKRRNSPVQHQSLVYQHQEGLL
jgi:hypothetical protein